MGHAHSVFFLLLFSVKSCLLYTSKRVTKPGGYILVAYIMNEYSVITYAIKEKHIKEGIEGGMLDAVSYTHLDVYKRQGNTRRQVRIASRY